MIRGLVYEVVKYVYNQGKRFTNEKYELKKYKIGNYSYGTPKIYNRGEAATLDIGKFCSIADGVKIFLGGNHHRERISTYPLKSFLLGDFSSNESYAKGDVTIGNDVWIGADVKIMSGVTIGDGAIIGTNSLVLKNVLPYEIVGGCPAKHISFRFTENEIRRLCEIKWRDRSIEKIKDHISLLQSDQIGNFIDICNHHDQPNH